MTDCDFLLDVLSDGQPHSLNDVLRRSFTERGCGLTVHSRVADLRKRGHVIHCERDPKARRGDAYLYTLTSLSSPPVVSSCGPLASDAIGGVESEVARPAPHLEHGLPVESEPRSIQLELT